MRHTVPLLIVLGLIGVGCSDTSPSAQDQSMSPTMGGMGHDGSDDDFTFGSPGNAGDVDRTVGVSMLDTFAFDPATLQVEAGESIRFVVSNPGQTDHEFVLGDESFQMDHEAEMGGMATPPPDEPNAITVEPGQTMELIWTFGEAGTVLYGCHLPDHYEEGMVGSVDVIGG